jgi:integrase
VAQQKIVITESHLVVPSNGILTALGYQMDQMAGFSTAQSPGGVNVNTDAEEHRSNTIKAPLKVDPPGKCSRWRVILYNTAKHKQEWHTANGTRREAEAFERAQKTRVASGIYIAKSDRRTFAEVAEMFLKERAARDRRTATIVCYETVFKCHLLPAFGPREVGTIRRSDIADHFDAMRSAGSTVQTVNRTLRAMKAVLFFALERELVERNVMQRFRPFEGGKNERHVSRGAFSESEIQAIVGAARPQDRVLIGLLCFTGLRPGEAYALDWSAVDLESGCLRVLRSWDHRGQKFVEPKTAAGVRVVPLSGWLVAELTAQKERSGGEGLVFANGNGKPMNPLTLDATSGYR